jgi:voltage-gated potassium channel
VRGPILASETFERAGIKSCRRVVIFPHQPDHAASDATTQTLVSLTERLAGPTVPVIHILIDPTNEDLFDGLRSKAVYSGFAIYAAIQECRDEGSAEIFTELMSSTRGPSPNTFRVNAVVGWTWGQFVERAMQVSKKLDIPVNPLALIQDGKSDPCPCTDTTIKSGDSLSLIVHRGFDYAAFEREIVG